MGKTALVLIDIQRDYFEGGRFALEGMEKAAARASKLLKYFRQRDEEIFHVRHIEEDSEAPFLAAGTEGIAIHELVMPRNDEIVVEKRWPNSFRDTNLLELLQQEGVSKIVFCGAMSNMCVDAAVRAAFDFGFECTVVEDACAAAELEFEGQAIGAVQVHGAFMAALASVYAQVVKLDDFLASQ